jgi:hypothetical protein
MPGENIQDWSTTATLNGNADSAINWSEGQPRDSVNNSSRAMMAAHAKQRNLLNGSIVTSGTANAQIFFSGINYTTTPTGLVVRLKIGPALSNTAACTLNMDGIGATAVLDAIGGALVGGELVAGGYADFVYNGTNWILLSPPSAYVHAEVPRMLAARSMFSAINAGPQGGFPDNVAAQVVFDTEGLDVGGNFTSSAWTPPAGRVLLSISLWTQINTPTSIAGFSIRKNAATVGTINVYYPSVFAGVPLTAVAVASGTDVFSVWATFASGGTVHASSYFTGTLI